MDQFLKVNQPNTDHDYTITIESDFEIDLDGEIFKVHKKVLQKNPFFFNLFLSQPDSNKIKVCNFNPKTFGLFINYLYTGEVFEKDVDKELFEIAHKYFDPILMNKCRETFVKNLSAENAVRELLFFLDHEETKLAKDAIILIAKNFNDIKHQKEFVQVMERPEVVAAIYDVFDDCKITVLSKEKNPDRKQVIDAAEKSDLTIQVQDHSFLCHTDILSQHTGIKTEISSTPKVGDCFSIKVHTTDPSTFKTLLNYIYTQDVEAADKSIELMRVANYYKDLKLQKICEDHLLTSVSEENALEMLILAMNFDSRKLQERAAKFIAENYSKVKRRDDFCQVEQKPEALQAILSQFAIRIDRINDSLEIQKVTWAFVGTLKLKMPVAAKVVKSQQFYLNNIAWHIQAVLTEGNRTSLRLCINCDDTRDDFEHRVKSTLELISNVGEKQNVCLGDAFDTYFPNGTFSGNCIRFVSLSNLNDEKKGLITKNTISVHVDARLIISK